MDDGGAAVVRNPKSEMFNDDDEALVAAVEQIRATKAKKCPVSAVKRYVESNEYHNGTVPNVARRLTPLTRHGAQRPSDV